MLCDNHDQGKDSGLSESFETGGIITVCQEYMQVVDLICHVS